MAKRLQIFVSDASWEILMEAQSKANEGFELGTITVGDLVDQAISQLELDAADLRMRKTDIKKVLKGFLKEENLSTENLIAKLSALGNQTRRNPKMKKAVNVGELSDD